MEEGATVHATHGFCISLAVPTNHIEGYGWAPSPLIPLQYPEEATGQSLWLSVEKRQ